MRWRTNCNSASDAISPAARIARRRCICWSANAGYSRAIASCNARDVDAQWRWAVSRALHEAIAREYPPFADQQLQRVRAILDAGEIASDAELQFVRHRIAVLEGDAQLSPELQPLYALVREYR